MSCSPSPTVIAADHEAEDIGSLVSGQCLIVLVPVAPTSRRTDTPSVVVQ